MFTTFHDTNGRMHKMQSTLATVILQMFQEAKYDMARRLPV